ncbi:MAG: class I SAM-dependent methyltransferase [Terriglobia bacterium]
MSHSGNPTLAYLYRRWLARRLVRDLPPGQFLEIGVGSGHFYEDLLERGYRGVGLDLNAALIAEHQRQAQHQAGQMEFRSMDFSMVQGQFDLVVAFEVLEHYAQDVVCLARWRDLLKTGGVLLFSVPAHMKQWTANDLQAGHARRYMRKRSFWKSFRWRVCRCGNYGAMAFPFFNLTYPLSSFFRKSLPSRQTEVVPTAIEKSPENPVGFAQGADPQIFSYDKTSRSGTRRYSITERWLASERFWWPFLRLQTGTLQKDWGIGYIVLCQRR